ncbi:hypothetical protein QFC21_004460 [Naganishia friedmannii]|uniref:Uncharacterized protein n=1 Tax=Naganishia friedmannii TaxID=89922 RepID=A0ACC2VH19_9TREE|nr:hypothetical protein QFC21_004460 [Naganishia friedmannii]
MPRHILSRSSAGQGSPSDAQSSPHISPKTLSASQFENGQRIPSADYYPPTWESHPILPGPPPKRPEKDHHRKSPFPERDLWSTPLRLPPSSSSAMVGEGDGRGWGGRGPARSENSVFPGVNSWPTSSALSATATAAISTSPIAAPSPVISPLPAAATSQHHTPRPQPAAIAPPYMPSPPRYPITPSYPPEVRRRPGRVEDCHERDHHWYTWMCCLRGKARKGIEVVG